jgi:hypothetical protein
MPNFISQPLIHKQRYIQLLLTGRLSKALISFAYIVCRSHKCLEHNRSLQLYVEFWEAIFRRSNVLRFAVVLFASQLALADIKPIGCFVDSSTKRLLDGLAHDYKADFPDSYLTSAGMTPASFAAG